MSERQASSFCGSWIFLVLLTLVLLTMASLAFGQADMPLQFQMKGRFCDPKIDPSAGGVNRFEVSVGDKQWILDIERADTLQGSMLGSSVLKQIYPPIMTFVGRKELTDQLSNSENLGRSYTMIGQLYVKKRMFRLSQVVDNEAMAEEKAAAESDSGDKPKQE